MPDKKMIFDMSGAVLTSDLLDQMQALACASGARTACAQEALGLTPPRQRLNKTGRPIVADLSQYVPPSDLPPAALIPFSAFAPAMPGTSKEWVERASRDGRFPAGVRLSPRKPMLFRAGSVATWLSERTAVLDAPAHLAETPSMTIAVVDESIRALAPDALKALITSGGKPMGVGQ